MSEQNIREEGNEKHSLSGRVQRLVFEDWDVLVLLVFFAAMIYQTVTSLEGIIGQFPLVFLVFGFVAIATELVVQLLPATHRDSVEQMTTGLAADMGEDIKATVGKREDEMPQGETANDGTQTRTYASARMSDKTAVLLTIAMITGFGVLSYYVSFVLTMPLFVFATFHLVGSRNYRNAALTSIILLVFLQLVFVDLMNVPIDSGVFFGWEKVMDMVGY